MSLRQYFREPIPEIELAAAMLHQASVAHAEGRTADAAERLRAADMKVVWHWLDSVWGAKSPYTLQRVIDTPLPEVPKELRSVPRDATAATKAAIHARDGHYCRFCKIPVVTARVRDRFRAAYPNAVPWGRTNATQHAAFQCMWAQYDHIIPHARGGTSDLDNVYLTCAACNYGRGKLMLEEVGIMHPDAHPVRVGPWDGLAAFR